MWACWDEDTLGGRKGKAVYLNGAEVSRSSEETYDVVKQGRLWRECRDVAGLKEGDVWLKGWVK